MNSKCGVHMDRERGGGGGEHERHMDREKGGGGGGSMRHMDRERGGEHEAYG